MIRSFSRTLLLSLTSLVLLAAPRAHADEGMWLLTQIRELALKAKGLAIDAAEIYRPDGPCISRAVIQLGGGTGEFVSEKGLILTNHHVVFDAVQSVSTEENNYVDHGFVTRSHDEERRTDYTAVVTLSVTDVTARVLEGLPANATESERQAQVDERSREIAREADRDDATPGVDYTVIEHFQGLGYYLYRRITFEDIRLVYAPPKSIGEFGGDIDNFEWPRHCGDFGLMRAYVSPNGEPARYSEDNVPYHPERWLTISTEGVKPGDFTFVVGHPGQTMRHRSSLSAAYHRDVTLPGQVAMIRGMVDQLEERSKASEAARLENIAQIKGLMNALKNFDGKVQGMNARHTVEAKQAWEHELQEFANADPERKARYGSTYEELGEIYARILHRNELRGILNATRRNPLVQRAATLAELAEEKHKPDAKRRLKYRDGRLDRLIEEAVSGMTDAGQATEQLVAALQDYASLDASAWPPVLRSAAQADDVKAAIEERVRELVGGSELTNDAKLTEWLKADADTIASIDDPLLTLGRQLESDRALSTQTAPLNDSLRRLRRDILALRQLRGDQVYPDANSTIRLTYGLVEGYSPRDAVTYTPITTVKGILEKETGVEPFHAPAKLLDLIKSKSWGAYAAGPDGVPVAFCHTTDVTGGNSGSPVLNAKGELVGVVFDGNIESLTADYWWDDAITRTISVDARYFLWILSQYDEAKELLEELGHGQTKEGADSGNGPMGAWVIDKDAMKEAMVAMARAQAGDNQQQLEMMRSMMNQMLDGLQIQIDVRADHTFAVSGSTTMLGEEREIQASGTWKQEGDHVTFETLVEDGEEREEPEMKEATLVEGRLEIDDGPMKIVFKRA